jgi:hypothetical protein
VDVPFPGLQVQPQFKKNFFSINNPSGAPDFASLRGFYTQLLDLVGWKGLPRTHTLGYLLMALVTKRKKSFITFFKVCPDWGVNLGRLKWHY